MKKKNVLRFTKWTALVVLFTGIFLSSCTKEESPQVNSTLKGKKIVEAPCGLVAGQHIPVGNVIVTNDDDNIYVTYETSGGWYLSELHLYVGTEDGLKDLTNHAGNPVIGHFPYFKEDLDPGTATYKFTIPLTEVNSDNGRYTIAAHAIVYNPETGQVETAWWNNCEPVFALKARMHDPNGVNGFWALSVGEPAGTGWCAHLGVNTFKPGSYTLWAPDYPILYSEPGTFSIAENGDVTVTANGDLQLVNVYFNFGTRSELAECPDFDHFFYKSPVINAESYTFNVPLPPPPSISFQEAFGAKRWGWFAYYCIH